MPINETDSDGENIDLEGLLRALRKPRESMAAITVDNQRTGLTEVRSTSRDKRRRSDFSLIYSSVETFCGECATWGCYRT